MRFSLSTLRRICLLCSILLSLGSAYRLAMSPNVAILARISEDAFARQVTRFTASVTEAEINSAIMEEIDAEPRNWVVIDSLLEIVDERSLTIAPETSIRLSDAEEQDGGLSRFAFNCAQCAFDSINCEMSVAMTCGITIEFTPFGDVAGLARAGRNYLSGEDIDAIDASLSAIGLTATSLAITSGGSSATIKAGAGFLKFVHRSGNLPPAFARILVKASKNGVRWSEMPSVRNTEDVARLVDLDAFSPAIDMTRSVGNMASDSGVIQSIAILKQTKTMTELQTVSDLAVSWKSQTAGYLRIIGENRVFRAVTRYADEIYGIVIGVAGLLVSLLWSLISLLLRRSLQRA